MKNTGGLLHAHLSGAVARLGHGDGVVVADAGLPVGVDPSFVDLALTPGVVSFLQVVTALRTELQVERIVVATEMIERDPERVASLQDLWPDASLQTVSHEELKRLAASASTFVRTGEYTPFSNVILYAGVPFR